MTDILTGPPHKNLVASLKRPLANGLIERTNRVVKSALTALVNKRPRIWHQFVPELRLQINTAIHRSTHEQPLYLLTGRHANFPVGLTNEAVFAENLNLQERLSEARKAAITASNDSRTSYGRYYNRGKKETFRPDVGSLVWYYEHGKHTGAAAPLSGRWRGPARVVSRLGPVTFEIRDVHTDVQMKAHLNHLKPFRTSHELSYESEDESDHDPEDVPANPEAQNSGRYFTRSASRSLPGAVDTSDPVDAAVPDGD
ncbi:uncharacterized protein LOC122254243 [Penaeus japonicus]|uniref:uncharacterized protein LOC122254243 n=1 Tax=Penaeus japonicus TaxID=27405 RepID=UPI001C71444B|nr:uncharacterized protein LOC122254243 [Penaeus japonicus]